MQQLAQAFLSKWYSRFAHGVVLLNDFVGSGVQGRELLNAAKA
jgi:hypothetical protein